MAALALVMAFMALWVSLLIPEELPGLIPDPALADAIREECGLEEGSEITFSNLASLRFLRASGRGIRSIEGLENCSSLQHNAIEGPDAVEDAVARLYLC